MHPRIKSPLFTLPGTQEALLTIAKATESGDIPRSTLQLVHLRVAQINGCGVCTDMHSRGLRKLGESDARIFTVAAWRDAPYFTDAERAALALAEAATRISDRPDAVGDELWREVSRHYSESGLAALLMTIALANLWNRLNVPIRQPSGDWVEKYI